MRRVSMKLEELNGNAYSLLAEFSRNAQEQGWNRKEVEAVEWQAKSGNYEHLLKVLLERTEPPEESDA